MRLMSILALGLAVLLTASAYAAKSVTPKKVVVEPPTLHCIGIEWHVEGDENENATCGVRYRQKGTSEWKQAQPLLRVENKIHSSYKVPYGNMLAGSLFLLKPATEYEVELTLKDPDGGAATKTVTVTTRAEPIPTSLVRRKIVGPTELNKVLSAAVPGDMIVLKPGAYSGFTVTKDGIKGKPIVVRGCERTKVVVNGSISASGRKYVHIENLTVNSTITISDTFGVVISGCIIKAPLGIHGMGDCSNCYIADNQIIGTGNWEKGRKGSEGNGVKVAGSGMVICYNLIKNHWDNISLYTGSYQKGPGGFQCSSIDVYGNDFYGGSDDGIEADYLNHNIRIYRNRLTNTGSAISYQPLYGGPGYALYNEIYNTRIKPFKWHVSPSGLISYHNTSLSSWAGWSTAPWSNGIVKNNIIFANPNFTKAGSEYVVRFSAQKALLDYNGYNKIKGGAAFSINNKVYNSLVALAKDGYERHGVLLDISIFQQAEYPFPGRSYKDPYGKPYDIGQMDLRLKPGAAAIDKGVVLPNINDGYTGKAPDLGCYEFGKDLPHYGPREKVLDRLNVEIPQ